MLLSREKKTLKNRDVHAGHKVNHSCDDVMMKVFSPAGAERFRANIRHMTGKNPLFVFKLCWKYLTPAVCTVSPAFLFIILKKSGDVQ